MVNDTKNYSINRFQIENTFDFVEGHEDLIKLIVSLCARHHDIPSEYKNDFIQETYLRVLDQIKEKNVLEKGTISTIIHYAILNAKRALYTKYILPVSPKKNRDTLTYLKLLNNILYLDKSLETSEDDESVTLLDLIPNIEKAYDDIERKDLYEKIKQLSKRILTEREFEIFFTYYIESDISQKDIAKKVGLSRQRVNMLINKAIRKLYTKKEIRDLCYALLA